jgi:hypothetical protein
MSRILGSPALAGALVLAGGVQAASAVLQGGVGWPASGASRPTEVDPLSDGSCDLALCAPEAGRAVVARTQMPAPLGGPAIKADEALVTISYQSFCYEAVVVLKGEPRVISGQVSSALGRHDALVSPGAAAYTVVLRSGPSRSSGIAGWIIDTSTGKARCTRSPLYQGALGRMSVHNSRGQLVCGL